jgi:HAMP domain-containing protein
MYRYPLFITVMADVIVAALTAAIVVVLGLLVWITWRLTVRAVSRIRPARRPSSRTAPAQITAILDQDGRDTGQTVLTRRDAPRSR